MHEPFNNDKFIGQEIRKLIEKWKIKTIVETGMWSAHSTREFATMGPHVITIDSTFDHLIEEFGSQAVGDLQKLNIRLVQGDSSECLFSILETILAIDHPILFYLDAHGGGENNSNVNPLLEELDQISYDDHCENNCVIAIHDFYVPGKEWGYNWGAWDGKPAEPLSYDLVKPFLEEIYPKGFNYHYNEKAEGMQRGIIYIYPKALVKV
jgi:hypothetical protein